MNTRNEISAECDFSKGVRGKYSAEKAVRDAWVRVSGVNDFYPGTAWTIYIYDDEKVLKSVVGGDKHAAWQAALSFTRQRQKEVAEIDEEIAWIDSFEVLARTPEHESARKRILSRLLTIREDLTKGMKARKDGGE